MSDKPMIFSTPMVQALLSTKPGVWPAEPIKPGKPFKSMTRRVLKYEFLPGYNPEWTGYRPVSEYGKFFLAGSRGEPATKPIKLPYQPGDRIWVRETTWISDCKRYLAQGLERGHSSDLDIVDLETGKRYIHQHDRSDYALTDRMITAWSWAGRYLRRSNRQTDDFDVSFADVDPTVKIIPFSGNIILKSFDAQFRKKLSSRYMPKAAARIWLTVMGVRVERLWEITDEDAQAEGISFDTAMEYSGWTPSYNDPDGSNAWPNYTDAYKDLWDSLNAKRGYPFDTNPYVTVIEFRRDEHD